MAKERATFDGQFHVLWKTGSKFSEQQKKFVVVINSMIIDTVHARTHAH